MCSQTHIKRKDKISFSFHWEKWALSLCIDFWTLSSSTWWFYNCHCCCSFIVVVFKETTSVPYFTIDYLWFHLDFSTNKWEKYIFSKNVVTFIVNVSLQLWRQTNNKKKALNKTHCDNKDKCHSWCWIKIGRKSL